MTDDTPISYEAAARGTQLLSSAGTQIGILEHVLQVPELDVFDGIAIATKAGLCFIDADYVQQITRRHVRCGLDDTQTAQLPPPEGSPVYHVDALADSGHSLHDILGRLFRRPHWITGLSCGNSRAGSQHPGGVLACVSKVRGHFPRSKYAADLQKREVFTFGRELGGWAAIGGLPTG
jgi:hypothetical protein